MILIIRNKKDYFFTKLGNYGHSAKGQHLFVIEREGRKPDMLEGFLPSFFARNLLKLGDHPKFTDISHHVSTCLKKTYKLRQWPCGESSLEVGFLFTSSTTSQEFRLLFAKIKIRSGRIWILTLTLF